MLAKAMRKCVGKGIVVVAALPAASRICETVYVNLFEDMTGSLQSQNPGKSA